jgi:hypothetical protein
VMNAIFTAPLPTAASASSHSASENALFTCATATPASARLSAWSYIRAISGETTSVMPGRCSAGSW